MSGVEIPNFFILGAAKGGTTSLHAFLSAHDQFFLAKEKETHFFNIDERYAAGTDYYLRRYFTGAKGFRFVGEATPAYFHAPSVVAPRIKCLLVQPPKFVVMVRDPVRRAYSHYLHRVRVNAETLSFESALDAEEGRLRQNPDEWVGYFSDGLYGNLFSQWLQYFERKYFYFIRYEDFAREPEVEVARMLEALGLSATSGSSKVPKKNVAGVPRSKLLMQLLQSPPTPIRWLVKKTLSEAVIRRVRYNLRAINVSNKNACVTNLSLDTAIKLRRRYALDISEFENLSGLNLSSWK